MARPSSFAWLAWFRPTPTARWLSLRHGPDEAACWAAVMAAPVAGEWVLLPAGRPPRAGDVATTFRVIAAEAKVLT
ncbi:MAG TPA: hypothetical protein VFW33_13755 [Gemmataceae bacterium]|nr:hypothetical protein [Gemmataceae bacterium]